MQSLLSDNYKNEFVAAFPGDDSGDLRPRQTPGMLYSKAKPTPVPKPELLAWSDELAEELGIQKPETQPEADVLAGNHITPGMQPYAACYAGHQFGNWAGQLGDGRAITLGEWQAPDGNSELQLKGAGPTAYSRRADGRAVLRSSVREYLMSEAMHHLGVPTTRALSLVATGDKIMRDMFYNGNPAYEPGAIVMRVAPTFLRFGSFEMPAARKELDNLRQLTNWTIDRYFPHIEGEGDEKILAWLRDVIERTATLMVEWQRVGFVHGVMNSDNMSILGLTIDYGPFSFLDDYDPNFTPNTTDLPGRRYAFGQQGAIGYWNLGCLAGAIANLFTDVQPLVAEIENYQEVYWAKYYRMMGNKLGLDELQPDDLKMFADWEEMMATLKPDMTIFYQLLAELPTDDLDEKTVINHFHSSFYNDPEPDQRDLLFTLINRYQMRVRASSITREESVELMRKTNPRFILRNYLLHQAIEELTEGERALFDKLHQAIKQPYSTNWDEFMVKRPQWAERQAGCSMLSCSS